MNRSVRKCVSQSTKLFVVRTLKTQTNSLLCRQRIETAINAEGRETVINSIYPLKTVEVKTIGHSGGDFNTNSYCRHKVGYVDSIMSEEYTPEQQIVVGLHGATDTHNEMSSVLEPLVNENRRVIILNFPGNRYTHGVTPQDSDKFRQTPEERGEFIRKFIKALKIPRVDLVVAHSSSCYALTSLLAKPDTDFIKAFALISPGPHELSSKVKPHYETMRRVNALWNQPLYRTLLKSFIKFMLWKSREKLTVEQTILILRQVASYDLPAVPGQLEKIKKKDIPRLMFYSHDDMYVGEELHLFKEYAHMLGITDEHFSVYDGDEKLVEQALTDNYPRGVIFKEGSHYPQFRHGHLIIKYLKELLDHVKHK